MDYGFQNELIFNLEKLHTTDLGVERIRRNIGMNVADVVDWCKEKIKEPGREIVRRGKNWYVRVGDYEITVNARSYTIITVHVVKK